ncbi:hypothetical protein DFLDMN_006205 (plasmid) [Cupriavidus sp. H19C3]|uniref:hypothetical protein n=1 Tax=Cupriavidus sp. H19C3 TaxID=3241603 RepID=UPI003BF834DF
MEMSNHERFNIVYDGPALAEHRMDVRDLAPALVAFADLFTAANKEINGEAAEVRVQVNATFRAGSFGIDLVATQHLLAQIRDMFAGSTATALANAGGILGLLGMVGGGLFGLLRALKGHAPVRIEQKGEFATVWITQTESIEVDARVLKLYRSTTVRGSLEKVLSPLERDGITDFGVVMNDEVLLKVFDFEIDLYRARPTTDAVIVSDTTSRKMLLIESLTFKDGNKWRVHDGVATFHASIEDEEFVKKIDAGERFGKGDVLVVDLRQVQSVSDGKLVTDSIIVKVLEHRLPLQQNLL